MHTEQSKTAQRHTQKTLKKYGVKVMATLGVSLMLASCANMPPLFNTNMGVVSQNAPPQNMVQNNMSNEASTFAQITDIPIPANSRLNEDDSIILGSQDMWTGRALIETPYSPSEMYDFFRREMVTFGWTELTSVRSNESVITFIRSQRIATVQIFGLAGGLSGSVVSMTIAPVERKDTTNTVIGQQPSSSFVIPAPGSVQQQNLPTGGGFRSPVPSPR